MNDAFFFGYGSLVNRATHNYTDAHPATARDWRRVWRHTPVRAEAFLTVHPAPGSHIRGLMASVPGNDWQALDEREEAYDRMPARDQIDHPLPHRPDVALYVIPVGKHGTPSPHRPILLSYLDVVVQGFLREYGEDGVQEFFDTTDGWDAPVLDDRADPRYPRHQTLTRAERSMVDEALADRRVRIIPG
ncbi:MAG: gamma-glutamylcyclotransferase [Sediminimonas qiaohouensis]|uniref:Gamma-glutamylcyclotransferase n=1 Tax=Sediminimonas qiaohouensis TaxID=552061 RepID=A0A7C9LB65_9RHOB|nr:gamma-glutamylcyclotransferase family protein [Sediminimonas qiaohouensis]MTJ04877.1 gamma-glutamylcyclotransferase [Sediminimonas qiaohouensis]